MCKLCPTVVAEGIAPQQTPAECHKTKCKIRTARKLDSAANTPYWRLAGQMPNSCPRTKCSASEMTEQHAPIGKHKPLNRPTRHVKPTAHVPHTSAPSGDRCGLHRYKTGFNAIIKLLDEQGFVVKSPPPLPPKKWRKGVSEAFLFSVYLFRLYFPS